MISRLSLEAAIVEEGLELYFLTLWLCFSYRSLHYLTSFLLSFPFFYLWFCFVGGGGVWCVRFGSDRPARDLQCEEERRHSETEQRTPCGLGFLNFSVSQKMLNIFSFFFSMYSLK
jgi:hypothetical protein